MAAFLDRWLDQVDPSRLGVRTRKSYATLIERHIDPAIGDLHVADLEAPDVQQMVGGMMRKGLSPQTAKHAHKVLRTALTQAVDWGLVPENVARRVKAPTVKRKSIRPLTPDQARTFLASVKGDEREAFYVLAITTGMRRGELLALRWEDVDLARGLVNVNATLRQVSRWRFVRDATKTERSTRILPLSALALGALRSHPRVSTDFVFARSDGRPWPPSEVTRTFQARLTAAGLPHARLHDLRHTAAALALDETGGDLRAVMALLGHSTIQTTVDTYGGLAEAARSRVAEGMDRVLGTANG